MSFKRHTKVFYRRHRTTIWAVIMVAFFFATYTTVSNADFNDCVLRGIC